jgi:dTDP-4-dehydrorhamnose reductase
MTLAARLPRILLIGANGQVGWELRRSLAPLGEVIAASLEGEYGPKVDLASPESLTRLVEATAPDAVVNAAAYTAVDRAEADAALAHKINAESLRVLGTLLRDRGVPVIHYSTDFVFSGEASRPYREDDEPGPLNVYGTTKLAGERFLTESGVPSIILRTSWVYGARGQNFLLTMLRLFAENDELRVVDDQIGAPTWSRMLAEVTAQALHRVLRREVGLEQVAGLYHVTAGGDTSWYGFAKAILDASGHGCNLLPIRSSEYRSPARRPAYSVLDNTKLWETFGLALPDWRVSLGQCLEDLR